MPLIVDASSAATTAAIVAFLREIGLRVEQGPVPDDTFLPGIQVISGGLRVDPLTLKYPGDLLHEAGHLAALSAAERRQPQPVVSADGGDEMMAIAWSYAAAVRLRLPLEVLFHADGYRGAAASLIAAFSQGHYVGVPMLQYRGLAFEPRLAAERGVPPFPHMVRWLRD